MIYGVWDYIKNSGTFKDVDNLTLEWASTIPGKRESRRFGGDYTLIQQDIINQTHFDDAIAYGGWAIDLHPSEGVYSGYHGCTQYHSKGVYTIPYRCIYSKDVSNLFFAGRLISVSHVAFGSTRVISTGTLCGQAAAAAAVLCLENNMFPREIYEKGQIGELQKRLMQSGQYIPRVASKQPADLVHEARILPSSSLELNDLPHDGSWYQMTRNSAMLLPFSEGKVPQITLLFNAEAPTNVEVSLCISSRTGNYTPDTCLAKKELLLLMGPSEVKIDFDVTLKEAQYGFIVLKKNNKVSVGQSEVRLTGVLTLFNNNTQQQDELYGIEEIPFYAPARRPAGKNFALKISPGLQAFDSQQLRTFVFRPASNRTNAWVAVLTDENPSLKIVWD